MIREKWKLSVIVMKSNEKYESQKKNSIKINFHVTGINFFSAFGNENVLPIELFLLKSCAQWKRSV